MTKNFSLSSLERLPDLASEIFLFCPNKKIFALSGEMGSGKTTLIGALCRMLGVKDRVTSPTFPIVNEYYATGRISHIDLYRLNSISEVLNIGIEEYLAGNEYCFIEWPQLIKILLPSDTVFIKIECDKEKRKITITSS
ncbi:MAG: tRNA (adenosine(37)-N6)-threonylcarbamoyltransferase complex ATPase subunit type 1 TsaE [Chitinophagales bacterium]|nr:tRNA (adenosine(37)-N6)-threonylcarbamoyltransferase complex ATPase subunit type 1 TsaE [Chitinophagales bacterium]